MADVEKVIKGLECCMAEKMCCNKCPYKGQCDDGGYYYSRAIEEALELLKAQEPRVMTLEEVKRLAPDDDVWIEYHELDGWTISAVTVREIYDNGILCRLQNPRFSFGRYNYYGGDWLAWRCWTSRPTNEQRKAVKWNG